MCYMKYEETRDKLDRKQLYIIVILFLCKNIFSLTHEVKHTYHFKLDVVQEISTYSHWLTF